MEHRERAFDNLFIERLLRSVQYETVDLHDYPSPREARPGLRHYLHLYNYDRPHQA